MAEPAQSKKSWARRGLGWLLQAALVLAVLFAVHLWQTRNVTSGSAPPLVGRTLQGEHFDLATADAGPLVVHFWATWCPVCRLELDNIADLQPEHRVISVAMMSGSDKQVLEYLRDEGVSFPVISDPQGKIAGTWGVSGVPSTFILDAEGKIRFVEVGYTTSAGLRARLWLSR
ncbi:MAG: protein disulfide oxidoreductase [Chromatiales bacterium]|jgi:peroxiredoxin